MATGRYRIRRSVNKAVPADADLERSELGYSFSSDRLFVRNEVTGQVQWIGGKALVDMVLNHDQALQGLNRLPVAEAVGVVVSDTEATTSGNILDQMQAIDPDGDTLAISGISYSTVARTLGVAFTTTFGSMSMSASGAWSFQLSAAARALTSGQTVSEVFTVTVTDGRGGYTSRPLTVEIHGTQQAPVVVASQGYAPFGQTYAGNVSSAITDPEGDPLTFIDYTILGISGTQTLGASVTIQGVGAFRLTNIGAVTFIPEPEFSGTVPRVTYRVTDGTNISSGFIDLFIAPPLTQRASNPVTYALVGSNRTFNVGPGQQYAHPDEVPWPSLTEGDVVNLFYRPEPYIAKIGICGRGTPSNPIILNGVTNSSGVRPTITGAGAVTPATMSPAEGKRMFTVDSDAALVEGVGTIILRRAVNEPDPDFKPGHIHIKNVVATGASDENTYVSLAGTTRNYSFSSGIYGQKTDDVLVENCIITGNTLGVFTHLNGAGRMWRCERWTIRSNRIYGNGRTGSNTEHGMYLQGLLFTTEFNFIGQNKLGAGGASSKHRVGQDIIRFNWIESHARALDLVEMEDQIPYNLDDPDESPNKPYYGIDYVYGNVIINDQDLPGGSSYRPVHYGADNAGEQEGGGAALIPGATHRKKLYFFNNTFLSNISGAAARNFIFQVSARDIVVELWNNIFYLTGNVPLHWTQHAGTLNFRGNNLVYRTGGTLTDAQYDANPANVRINYIGTVLQNDPKLLSVTANARDLSLIDTSPALDVALSFPSGLEHDLSLYPVDFQPRRQTNGSTGRTTIGAGSDLGAFEFDPLAPPDAAPSNITPPTIPGTAVVGATIVAQPGSWLRMAAGTYSFQWEQNSGGNWTVIPNSPTTDTYVVDVTGDIRVRVFATNAIGTSDKESDICVASASTITAPTIAQVRADQNVYRDVGPGAGVAAAQGAPTTNFLVFYTESKATPEGAALVFYGSALAPYMQHLTTVACAADKYVSVFAATNVPSSVGATIEAASYPTNGYASVTTVEIPGAITVGTPITDPTMTTAGTYTSSQLTIASGGALLVAYAATRLGTNGAFTWSNGFAEAASIAQAIEAPRMHSSVASRVAGAGTYQARVQITGTLDANGVGMVVVPVSFS